MTSPVAAPALVVRGPDSLPSLVPHLVGFHPARSLVVLGLAPDTHCVRVTVRVDLPALDLRDDDAMLPWVSAFDALRRAEATDVILLVYPGDDEDPWAGPVAADLPRRHLVDLLGDELEARGVAMLDALCISGQRLRSYVCDLSACCPREGRVVDATEGLRVRALFVEQGSAPLAKREDLLTALAERPADDPLRARIARSRDGIVSRLPAGVEVRVTQHVEDLRAWGAEPRGSTTLARLVVVAGWLCASVRSRDLLLRSLTVGGDLGLLAAARSVLGESVRCASGVEVAPVASVLAVCCWVSGDGAAARVALDRAFESDPGYSLAGLVSAALDHGAPPWTWTQMMGELSVAAILGEDDLDDDPDL
jgi:hypothetical protein